MPEEKYGYRPAEGKLKNEKPQFGPAEVRTFAEQVKHGACSNFGFAAELDGQKPPEGCDKEGPSPAKTKKELLIFLRYPFPPIPTHPPPAPPKPTSTPTQVPDAR